jgi:hypothetical protein
MGGGSASHPAAKSARRRDNVRPFADTVAPVCATMPRPSIDYINARQAHIPASGGRNYAKHDRMVNAAAERERLAELDAFERIREMAHARFADMRSVDREWFDRLRSGLRADEDIPF